MVGILMLKQEYRFITDTQQLSELLNDMRDHPDSVKHTILLIDANLQTDLRTATATMIQDLAMIYRHYDLQLIFIRNEHTRINNRIKLAVTDNLTLVREEIPWQNK